MLWAKAEPINSRRNVGEALVSAIEKFGLNDRALNFVRDSRSEEALDCEFLRSATDVVWYISYISDASMAIECDAACLVMSEVIGIRFEQNRHLKPFVRRVMSYDFFHPIQAICRMQRTAGVMYQCLSGSPRKNVYRLALLNIVYTLLVFLWLIDKSGDGKSMQGRTTKAMLFIGLA